ncbi:MAG: hypothetical protein N2C12_17370 [Planctomycetales bacterium]
MSLNQLTVGRNGLCVAGRCVEPTVEASRLLETLSDQDVEQLRPLLPVGYRCVAEAYRTSASDLTARDLSQHYTNGMESFHDEFIPFLKQQLSDLSGNQWNLDNYVAYAAGSDVDLMSHLVEAISARGPVSLFPGDWYGFYLGSTHTDNIHWEYQPSGSLACLCIPSVRNGHVTDEMIDFLGSAKSCLLNLNLYPTLTAAERQQVAMRLEPLLPRSVLSISFSRGFGLTASQLGIFLIHQDHPYRPQFEQQWNWHSYFYNALAVKAFRNIDLAALQSVDDSRRLWVHDWLTDHGLPAIDTGSYYVKTFAIDDQPVPGRLKPLVRDGMIRLCFKPPQT